MIDEILALSPSIRYVAVYRDGRLSSQSRGGIAAPSSGESDRYEELLVNPTLLKLASQRGNIDCGGLDYLILRYGKFFQIVLPASWGHLSVCLEPGADPVGMAARLVPFVAAPAGRAGTPPG